jgi:hypothetical protein
MKVLKEKISHERGAAGPDRVSACDALTFGADRARRSDGVLETRVDRTPH